jgi:L-fuculose-phosphate aldolase
MTPTSPAATALLDEDSTSLREALIRTAAAMNTAGINVNKAGNVSARCIRGEAEGLLITPTGVAYERLQPHSLVFLRLADGVPIGAKAPSSEWRFHVDLYRRRPEFRAIVHTHSPAATALACHGRGIPPFHYMVAAAGGGDIRCAPYATFGTQALSDLAVAALADRKACLLAHHGVIACEASLERALALAIEVEHLARMYLAACQIGEPPLLSPDEMARVLAKFASYGQDFDAP